MLGGPELDEAGNGSTLAGEQLAAPALGVVVRRGVRLGVDAGTVRVGIAVCDPEGTLATPLETLRRGVGDLDRILALAAERDAVEIVVGLPVSLSGREGAAAAAARDYATELADRLPAHGSTRTSHIAVRLVDERLTTSVAARGMRAAGVTSRRGRSIIDAAAAAVILQGALDAERATDRPPGEILRGSA